MIGVRNINQPENAVAQRTAQKCEAEWFRSGKKEKDQKEGKKAINNLTAPKFLQATRQGASYLMHIFLSYQKETF